MPYDPTTPAGQVRLLVNDTQEPPKQIFNDVEILAFLTLESGHVKLAAAQAIDTIADDEALTSKVIKDHDLSTDGAAVAKALHDRATLLRRQWESDVAGAEGSLVWWFPDSADPIDITVVGWL